MLFLSKLHIQFILLYTHCKTSRTLNLVQHKVKQNYCAGVPLKGLSHEIDFLKFDKIYRTRRRPLFRPRIEQ